MGSLLLGKQIKKNVEKVADVAEKTGIKPLAGVVGEQIVKQRKKLPGVAPTILKDNTIPSADGLL